MNTFLLSFPSDYPRMFFFYSCHRNRVLSISKSIEDIGRVNWEILLCLIAMWIICYFCIWKGVRSTGKVCLYTYILFLATNNHTLLFTLMVIKQSDKIMPKVILYILYLLFSGGIFYSHTSLCDVAGIAGSGTDSAWSHAGC